MQKKKQSISPVTLHENRVKAETENKSQEDSEKHQEDNIEETDVAISEHLKNQRIERISKCVSNLAWETESEKITRFVYLGNPKTIRNEDIISRQIITPYGTLFILKNQMRLSAIRAQTGFPEKNFVYFKNTSTKATTVIEEMKKLKNKVKDEEPDELSVYSKIILEVQNQTLSEIVKKAYQDKDINKIKEILEHRKELDYLENLLRK